MHQAGLGTALAAGAVMALTPQVRAASPLMPCAACRLPPQRAALARYASSAAAGPASDELFRIGLPGRGLATSVAAASLSSHRGGFMVEAVRRTARTAMSLDRVGTRREKLSVASVALRYETDLGDEDRVTFGIAGSLEKRRYALDLTGGHISTSRAAGLEAAWMHGPSWRMSAGYRVDTGSSRATGVVRQIELAEGATRSQRGPWMAIAFTPAADRDHEMTFGAKLQSFTLSETDRLALGAATRTDNRAMLTASLHFR